jgi:hypothetical protein
MNATKWNNLIPNIKMTDDMKKEMEEADEYLAKLDEATKKAASFLNKEFQSVPASTWENALNNPDAVQFTDSNKEARFVAAQKWIATQVR